MLNLLTDILDSLSKTNISAREYESEAYCDFNQFLIS